MHFPTALLLEAELVSFYRLDEAAQEVASEARMEVTETTLETLEGTLERLFK